MPLPRYLTTVTPFSKFVALALFVALPFAGFHFGQEYEEAKQFFKQQVAKNYIVQFETPFYIGNNVYLSFSKPVNDPEAEGGTVKPTKGYHFFISKITLENKGRTSAMLFNPLSQRITALGSDGIVYTTAMYGSGDPKFTFDSLAPGQRTEAFVNFELPSRTQVKSIMFADRIVSVQ